MALMEQLHPELNHTLDGRMQSGDERICLEPHPAVFSRVEGRVPHPFRGRIAIRNRELRDRRAMQDRTHAPVILVADGVEDNAFARRHREAEAPPLPGDFMAVDLEAPALRLRHDERRV